MKRFLSATAVGLMIVLTFACQRSTVAPSPKPPGSTGVVALTIQGPDRLAPGETARFTAIATMGDRSTEDHTQKVSWRSFPTDVITIASTTGEAMARTSGDAVVWADTSSNCCHGTRMAILVLPPNSHRLTGRVQEAGLPLQGATVSVVSGIGSGLSTATDYNGEYRLYGVAGGLEIKVNKAGYVDLVKSFTASRNDVLDFPEARQTQALPSVSGSYTLTLRADASCPTTSSDPRDRHLPAEMHQARSYVVQVTQDGPTLHVVAPSASFLPPSNRFDGRITPDTIEFQFGDGYIGYGPDNAFTAHLSPTQALSYEGQISATRVGSAIVGRLDGEIQLFENDGFFRAIGHCRAGNHVFSMSAATTGTTR